MIAIWVDHGLITASNMDLIQNVIKHLNTEFEISTNSADHFVGLVSSRDRLEKKIYLSIPQYIEKVLTKFNIQQAETLKTPALKGTPRLKKSNTV